MRTMTNRTNLARGLLCLSFLAVTACGLSSTSGDASPKKDVRGPEANPGSEAGTDTGGSGGSDAAPADTMVNPTADGGADVPHDGPADAPADKAVDSAVDTHVVDAATPDAPSVDAATPDAPTPDVATPDVSTADAGPDVHFSPDVGDNDYAIEAEDASPTAPAGINDDTVDDLMASAGVFEILLATKAGDSLDFTLPEVPAGTYQFSLEWKGNADRGIATVTVNNTVLGTPLDQYTVDDTYNKTVLGTVTVTAAADVPVHVQVTGKNAAASEFFIAADRFVLIKQP
jgi:hypothetical protein